MPFAQETRTYSDTAKRTSAAYVKLVPEYRTVLRILNPNAKLVWKHWISEANAGRGMMAACPNTSAQDKVCPIEKSVAHLPKDSDERRAANARKRYMVNVLDRTPVTVCDSCNNQTPGKTCQHCSADLKKKKDFVPLNKVKILEGGPQLFTQTLNAVEKMQSEEFDGAEITDYDIVFQSIGVGRDKKTSAIPQPLSEISEADLEDPETGEPQKLFDLDLLAEPNTVEEIELMLKGATIADLNALRGIE
jgi:hypothetical protein